MRAVRLHAVGERPTVDELPVPARAKGQALIRVGAAGLCGSDAHIVTGRTPLPAYPRVLGHEVAGTVESADEDSSFRPGDRVAVNFLVTCGSCRYCSAGRSSLCLHREGLGVVHDGGFAEYLVAPEANLVPVPAAVPFRHAALATDAFATPLHAISARAGVGPDAVCAVIGAGGLGLAAVQLLRARAAKSILAVDVSPLALELAGTAGATETRTFDDAAALAAGGGPAELGADFVFDFVGSPETTRLGIELLGRGGKLVVVGHSGESWRTLPGSSMVRDEKAVIGSYSFDNSEIREALNFMGRGLLDPETLIGRTTDLDGAAGALAPSAPRTPGRTVVVPSPE
ncbi:zinc-dependent alcohol dehydrogenase family protein [Sinomonas notoginsengisoli]|uniref:alcohol dehydrogenase catalytic domain-containing protein n=1 Tax=Sinomonas notoginsengisoli TaxID=1457311 RepID=UPI001F3EFED1|nr:zinc-binding dehydrogenase [Sinomonas notoginsengisoli]